MSKATLSRLGVSARGLWALGLAAYLSACSVDPGLSQTDSVRPKLAINPDGDVTVTTTGRVLNTYSPLQLPAVVGDTAVTVQSLSQLGVKADDLVMIIQMQGAQMAVSDDDQYGTVQNLQGAGLYELVRVRGVDSATSRVLLDTRCGGLRNAYSVTGRSQVVRVPQVGNLQVTTGSSIVALPWDGQKGGVIAVRASGNIVVDGIVDASGQGFRGGAAQTGLGVQADESTDRPGFRTSIATQGAAKGEGIAGSASDYATQSGGLGRGAPANGGGGGNGFKSGGGGGAGGGGSRTYDGSGVMDNSAVGKAAWSLDPITISQGKLSTSSGGGRGGYSSSSSDQDALTVGPGSSAWGANKRQERGGRGGHPLVQSPSSRLFMGGGGGAGDANGKTAATGAPGGNGGGLIFLWGNRLAGVGRVLSTGQAGSGTSAPSHDQGAGGGGGGGTIALMLPTVEGSLRLTATGGIGGSQGVPANATDAAGPGGGGGGGVLILPSTLPITVQRDTQGAAAGSSQATAVSEFPVNGATRGSEGEEQTFVPGSALPSCLPTDLAISLSSAQKSAVPGSTYTLTVTVENVGTELTTAAPLSSLLTPLGIPSVNWSCSATPTVATETASCSPVRGFQDLSGTVSLSPGQKAIYQVVISVPSAASGSLVYQAQVAAASGTSDADPSNNQASVTVPIQPSADLQVLLTPAPVPAAPAQPVTMIVSARNMGPSDARDVVLRFAVPDGFTVVKEPSSPNLVCTGSRSGYECSESQLERFTTHDVQLVIEPDAGTSPTELRVSATVSGSVPDDVLDNNTAQVVVPYDDTLAPYRKVQLRGGGLSCGLGQSSTFQPQPHSVLALLLCATALRLSRRLRRSRPFRTR